MGKNIKQLSLTHIFLSGLLSFTLTTATTVFADDQHARDCSKTDSLPIIYVNENAIGNNDGTSWKNAYKDLQQALNQANLLGVPMQIWVAKGIYKPGVNRTNTFIIPNKVKMYGGFIGSEKHLCQRRFEDQDRNHHSDNDDHEKMGADPTRLVYQTILSGDLLGNDVVNAPGAFIDSASHIDNSYHVVTGNNVTFLMNGFTIYGGYVEATGLPGEPGSDPGTGRVLGAGLYFRNGDAANAVIDKNSVILEMMVFKDNYINGQVNGNGAGGGAALRNPNALNGDTLSVTMTDSIFVNNHAARLVAAIDVNNATTYFSENVFDFNRAETPFASNSGGGGASLGADLNVTGIVGMIEHNSFTNNRSGGGGASLNLSNAIAHVKNTEFINNSNVTPGFAFRGGALFTSGNDTYISDSLFEGNSTTFSGGAIVCIGPSALVPTTPTGSLTIEKTKFMNNFTTGAVVAQLGGVLASQGGAIGAFFAPIKITNSLFEDNEAQDPTLAGISPNVGGGAIYALRLGPQRYLSSIEISNTKFIDNKTPGDGGAILDTSTLSFTIGDSHFNKNSAGKSGGAIYLTDMGAPTTNPVNRVMVVNDNRFEDNVSLKGGAIAMIDNSGTLAFNLETLTLNINDSRFDDNLASQSGEALYQVGGIMSVIKNDFNNDNALLEKEVYIDLPATTNEETADPAISNALVNANKGLNNKIEVVP